MSPEFSQIAAMHSELVAISTDGKLYQWCWDSILPYHSEESGGVDMFHPRTKSLGLLEERTVALSASSIRASVLTESGKVRRMRFDRFTSKFKKYILPTQRKCISEAARIAASSTRFWRVGFYWEE